MEYKNNDVNVLFIPFGSGQAAATRYRVSQYLPYLSKTGIRHKVFSSISEWTTKQMIQSPNFKGIRKSIYYLHVVLERIFRFYPILFLATRYKIVFLQRTTFPFGLERLLKRVNKNIIFDIDDSIYMPDAEESGLIGVVKKYIKRKEVISILKVSQCAIVENNHIKKFVKKYCDQIYIITGPIDTARNYARRDNSNPDELTIGWIGSPSTTLYLKMLDGVLQQLSKRYKIKLRLIGATFYAIEGVKVEVVNWKEKTEILELHKFDIGIMPMPDNEWTRGKVGCKMLQYMANAIPAVVSHTPTNAEIIKDGINGFLVNSEEEWIEKISLLINNPGLRCKIGIAGRKTVEERFSLDVSSPKFLEILRDL